MYLIQGLMSAISAGMLIYVSTVEMIAGDFVFGDVGGHSHHGHGHSHDHRFMEDEQRTHTKQAKSGSRTSGTTAQSEEPTTPPFAEDEALESNEDHYHHHLHHGNI